VGPRAWGAPKLWPWDQPAVASTPPPPSQDLAGNKTLSVAQVSCYQCISARPVSQIAQVSNVSFWLVTIQGAPAQGRPEGGGSVCVCVCVCGGVGEVDRAEGPGWVLIVQIQRSLSMQRWASGAGGVWGLKHAHVFQPPRRRVRSWPG
jgi:hypothetical protein